MAIDARGIQRFIKYSLVGGPTFALDLALLFILTDIYGWHPVYAAGASFALAVSINYFISRRFVFHGSLRSTHTGYGIFLSIALSGLAIVTGFMALFIHVFGWNYLLSRMLIAIITGFWNYLLNLYVNFKVAGQHST